MGPQLIKPWPITPHIEADAPVAASLVESLNLETLLATHSLTGWLKKCMNECIGTCKLRPWSLCWSLKGQWNTSKHLAIYWLTQPESWLPSNPQAWSLYPRHCLWLPSLSCSSNVFRTEQSTLVTHAPSTQHNQFLAKQVPVKMCKTQIPWHISILYMVCKDCKLDI